MCDHTIQITCTNIIKYKIKHYLRFVTSMCEIIQDSWSSSGCMPKVASTRTKFPSPLFPFFHSSFLFTIPNLILNFHSDFKTKHHFYHHWFHCPPPFLPHLLKLQKTSKEMQNFHAIFDTIYINLNTKCRDWGTVQL